MKATEADRKDEEIQVAILLHSIGEDGLEAFNTFEFEQEADKKKINVLLTKFDDDCSPRKNSLFERFKFWNRSQQKGETVDQFVTELKRMLKNCEYTESTDAMVRDSLVFGIRDAKVQSQLLRIDVDKLTLEKALYHCRSVEVTESQLKEISGQSTEKQVLAVSKSSKQPDLTHFNCPKCGGRHGLKQCPAFGKTCFVCD